MVFFIVSDQKKLATKIDSLKINIQILDPAEFRKILKSGAENRIFYLDKSPDIF